jgi:hypothetical protein
MKKLIILVFISLLTTSNFAVGGAGTLLEMILDRSVGAILKQDSALSSSATNIQTDIATALLGIARKTDPSSQDVTKAIGELPVTTADDIKLRDELLILLAKEDPSAEDIVASKDKMIILARNLNLLDRSAFIACSGSCTAAGARLAIATDEVIVNIAKEIPQDIPGQERLIGSMMTKLNIDRPRNWKRLINNDDYKALATFLKLAENGSAATPAQRKMINAIFEFSSEGDKVKLIDADNLQLFYREMITGNYSDEELVAFADLLSEAAKKSPSTPGRKDAFYSLLEEKAKRDPAKRDALKGLRESNCFFK